MRKSIFLILAFMLSAVLPVFSAVQYNLGPVDFESGTIPAGWTQQSVVGTVSWAVEGGTGASLTEPLNANNGAYRAAIRPATDQAYYKTRLESPAMNLVPAYNPQLHFSHAQVARFEFFDTLRVYYRVNATATWQLLTEYTSPLAGWTSETILLPAYTQGSAYQLAFEASGQYGYGVVLDDISVYPQSQCQDALFQDISVTSTSATIGFVCNGSYNHFELAVSSTPIADLRTVNLDSLTYHGTTADYESTVTGLQPYTTYYVYLRTDCDDNPSGYTNWVSTTLKTTSMVNLPYTENFTQTETIIGNSYCGRPYGWTTGGMKNINVPCVYKGTSSKASYSVDSTNYLLFSGTASTTATPVPADSVIYAITPEINGNLANCEVDFWGTSYVYLSNGGNKDYAAELTVGVVTNPNDIATLEVIETVKMDNGDQFKHFRVSLAGYTGTGKYVALVSMADKPNMFYVDSLTIKEVSVCTPTNLRALNVLPTGFELLPQLNGADSWNLKVATAYNRDASLIADSLVLVNQTGLTAASYQVQLPASMEGNVVIAYVQGVKNGVASEWSAPLTLHVPTTGVVPMFFDFTTNAKFYIRKLVNEHHAMKSTEGFKDLISPMLLFDNYPTAAYATPVFDGAFLKLNGVDNYVAFPYVADLSQLEISFRLSSGGSTYAGSGRVAVGVMTDPYDLSTFEEIARYDAADGSYKKIRQPLDGYTGNGHYVAIRAITPATPSATYGSHNCIDNVRIQTISTCFDALDVQANPSARSAVVSWNPNGMTDFKLTLYSNYDSAWVDTVIFKTTAAGAELDSVRFTGLTPDTEYDFTIQTICGRDTLIVEDVYSFRTKIGVPYQPVLLTNAIPTGWTRKSGLLSDVFLYGDSVLKTTSSGWTYNKDVNVPDLNNPHLKVNIYGTSCKYWLVSPEINMDLQPNEGAALKFKAAWTKYGNNSACTQTTPDDKFAVVISTDGGKTWSRNNAYIWANDGSGNRGLVDDFTNTGTLVTIPLTKYVGQKILIGFYGESTVSGGDNDFRISEISIELVDASCQGLGSLVGEVTGSTTANLLWEASGTQKAYLKVTTAEDSTVVFADTVTASPYALTNLQPNTLYNVIGYQVCSDDTLSSSFRTECDAMSVEQFGMETFDPKGTTFTCWQVGVIDTTGVGTNKLTLPDAVSKAKFGYVLAMEKKANTSTKGYGNDYYAILPSLQVDSINKYQVVFDAATPNSPADSTNASDLYIGIITDVEDFQTLEIIDTVHLKYAADSTELRTFAISFDSYMGDLMGDFGKNVIFVVEAPAEKNNVAYIDNVRFEEAAGCHQVIDLEQTGKWSTAVELSWSGNAAQYEVVMDTVRFDPAQVANPMFRQTGITADTLTITNLTPGTTYYAYIRGICGAADTATWSSYTKVVTSYGIPYLETFDLINEQYPTSSWKVFNQTVPSGDFSTAGFTVSANEYRMSIQPVDTRMSNMAGKVARTEVYSSSYNGFLQSPAIDLSTVEVGSGVQLTFRAGMLPYYSSTPTLADMTGRTFRVYVSEDGGETFKAENMIEWNCEGTGDYDYAALNTPNATKFMIDLSDYAGKTIALGFYSGSTVSSPDAYLLIDSVAVETYDNSCQGISQLRYRMDVRNVYVTWSNQIENLGVIVELATDAEFSNIVYRDSIVGDSVVFSNLAYSTTYYLRANPECVGSWNELTFTTSAGVPFTEDFNKTGTNVPAGWLRYSGDPFSGNLSTTTSIYFSASNGGGFTDPHVYCSTNKPSTSGPKQYTFVSPEIFMDQDGSNDLLLTFDLAVTTSSSGSTAPTNADCVGHTFAVAVLAEDSTNWTPVRVWQDSAFKALPSVAETQTIDLTAYAGQYVRIAFYAAADTTSTTNAIYHNIDNIRVRNHNAACEAPILQANGYTNTTASLKWQVETGMQYKVQVAYSTAFSPLIDSLTTTDSVHTFTDLTPGSVLYIRAKKVCSTGCESAWSEYLRMQLPCEGITNYPWSENFDNVTAGFFEKDCWYNVHLEGTGYQFFEGYTADLAGNVTGKICHPKMASGTMTLLALPQMTFAQDKVYRFSVTLYRSASGTSNVQEGIRVFLSDGAYLNAQSQEIVFLPRNITVTSNNIPAEDEVGWYTYQFLFRASGDKTIVLRGETTNGSSCYIDDLMVEEFEPTQTIDKVSINRITNRSARLTWSLVDPSICHDAEIVVSQTVLDSAALEQAAKQTVQNTLSTIIEGLDRETHYYMYVRTVCGSTYGDWMMADCTTKPLNFETTEQFGDGTATAYLIYSSYGNTISQHIYLADELLEAGLIPGPITSVAFQYTGSSSTYKKTQSVYMGITDKEKYAGSTASYFETNQQLVYGPTLRTYQQGWVTYTFTEPFIWDGVSNIAVTVLTNGDGTHTTSSGWAAAGTNQKNYLTIYRYIDRTVINPANISGTTSSGSNSKTRPNARFTNAISEEACPAVETVEAELVGLGISEARVSWTASIGNYVSDYDVFVSTEKMADTAVVTPQYPGIDSLSLVLTNLTPETKHYIYVRANCDARGHDDGVSSWAMDSITTLANCMPVSDLAVRFTDVDRVEITWSKSMDEQDNDFRYILSTAAIDSSAIEQAALLQDTTMHLVFDSLQLETTYYFYVRSTCSDKISSWRSITFTTLASCQAVDSLHVDRVSAHAARIAWQHAPLAFEDQWEVGIVGQPAFTLLTADTFAVFSGLQSDSAYTAYVRAICSEGDTSAINMVSFRTTNVVGAECIYTAESSTTNGHNAPFNNYYNNSWTQMIYPDSLIGLPGNITSISFHCATGGTLTQESVKIYMANTDMTVAATTTDWIAEDELMLVAEFTNFVHPTESNVWLTIPLSSEFAYTGGNLAVVVAVQATDNTNAIKYSYVSSPSGTMLYRRSDTDVSCGDYPLVAGTKSTYLPIAQFCITTGGCTSVSDIVVKDITTNSASASWFPGNDETAWRTITSLTKLSAAELAAAQADTVTLPKQQLSLLADKEYYFYVAPICSENENKWKFKKFATLPTCQIPVRLTLDSVTATTAALHFCYGGTEPAPAYELAYGNSMFFDINDTATYQTIIVSDTTAVLTGLQGNTHYSVAVRSLCGDDDYSRWSAPITLLTDCGITTEYPWGEDFEMYSTGNFSQQCWVNRHTAVSGSYGSYVFQIATLTGTEGKVMKLRDQAAGNLTLLSSPEMFFPEEQLLEFSIDVYRSHYSTIKYNEGLRIYVSATDTIDESAQLLAFIPRQYTVEGINAPAVDSIRWESYHFPVVFSGVGHILIEGVSEYGAATYFDNLSLSYLDTLCGGVVGLETSNFTFTTADVRWTTIGNDSVEVLVTDEANTQVFSRITSDDSITITGLASGTNYKVSVTQLCSGRKLYASFTTLYTTPLFENATKPSNWISYYNSANGSYWWKNTSTASYILGEMQDTVFYLPLYYYYDVWSRLTSPEIYIPQIAADEAVRLDWLMGATTYSSRGASRLDPSTVVRMEVLNVDDDSAVWTPMQTWSDSLLSEIPWGNSGRFNANLSQFAGHFIQLGFYAGITEADSSATMSIDNIHLRVVKKREYSATTCSSVDYQDAYFSIPKQEYVLGTTEYETLRAGNDGALDTLVVLSLTVNQATETELYDTICEGRLYDRNGVAAFIATTSVVKPLFLTAVNGCDSLVRVNIEVIPAVRRDTTILACKGSAVEVNGKMYYSDIVVVDTLPAVNTCDSIVRTFIEFSDSEKYTVDQHRIICAGDTYTDAAFPNGISTAGTFTATVTTAYGCDSTVTIHMLVANNGAAYDTITLAQLPYVYAEDTIIGTNIGIGDYEFPLQATCGQVTLHINVKDTAQAVDNLKVLQLSVAPNPAAVGEPIEILSQVSMAPDFSLMVFDAIGQLVYTTDEPSLTIPGLPVAGYYTVRLTSDGQSFQAKLLVK